MSVCLPVCLLSIYIYIDEELSEDSDEIKEAQFFRGLIGVVYCFQTSSENKTGIHIQNTVTHQVLVWWCSLSILHNKRTEL